MVSSHHPSILSLDGRGLSLRDLLSLRRPWPVTRVVRRGICRRGCMCVAVLVRVGCRVLLRRTVGVLSVPVTGLAGRIVELPFLSSSSCVWRHVSGAVNPCLRVRRWCWGFWRVVNDDDLGGPRNTILVEGAPIRGLLLFHR